MATRRASIMRGAVPDAQGDCWFEPYSILATNDQWRHLILRMGASNAAQPTLKAGVYGAFTVPKDYVAGAALIVVWTATLTSGNVVFDFDYRTVGGNDTTSLDQSGTEEAVTGTDAAPGAANRRLELSIDITDGNLAVDDLVEFYFARDGTDGSDTMAGSAIVHDVLLEYTT